MVTKQDMDRIKFDVFNDLEDEINNATLSRAGDEITGMEALYMLSDCCVRIWARLETKHVTREELPDE